MKRLILAVSVAVILAACGSEEEPTPDLFPTVPPAATLAPTPDYGLEVEILEQAAGPAPNLGDVVVISYTATLEDGTVFDETGEEPFSFKLGEDRIIRGLEQAIPQITVGSTARVVVPPELGYGETGAGEVVPPDATLIYEIKVLDLNPVILSDDLGIPEGTEPIITVGGVEVYIIEEGDGPKPVAGDTVSAHYRGTLVDGTPFDNSYDRGQPFEFVLVTGSVIQGWHEGFAELTEGSKAVLVIPPELGYGPAGSPPAIPSNATLIFEVELLEVTSP